MRITFVLPVLDMSGGNRIVSMYARLAASAGHAVRVVVAGPRPLGLKARLKKVLKPAPAHQAPAGRRSHFDGLTLSVDMLDRYRRLKPDDLPNADVLIATWWETAEWVAEQPASKGAKVYLVQHHEIFDRAHEDRVRATYRLPLHKIVIAPWLADLMRTEYGDATTDLVPNATDPADFSAPPRERQAKPTVGLHVRKQRLQGLRRRALHAAAACRHVP